MMTHRRLAVLFMAVLAATQLAAAPSMFKERKRMDRIDQAETRWQEPERVTLNIHYRVPVIDTLGYLAAFNPDAQKLTTIASDLRPIATRVEELSGDRFEGRSFPPEVDAECRKLRNVMFTFVKEVYGQEAVDRIQRYLELKYGSLSGYSFSEIEQ